MSNTAFVPAIRHGDLVRVDSVVLRFTAVDGLHVESVAEHEANALARAQIGESVPGEDALDGDDEVVATRCNHAQEGLGLGAQVLVHHDGARGVEDAHVHGACMQIDAAVVSVLLCVEVNQGSSSLPGGEVRCWSQPPYPVTVTRRRP